MVTVGKDDTVYEGEVSGEGTSRRSSDSSSRSSNSRRTIYDVEWEDVTDSPTSSRGSSFLNQLISGASTVSDTARVFSGLASKMSSYTPQVSAGQSFIAGLLEPPKN